MNFSFIFYGGCSYLAQCYPECGDDNDGSIHRYGIGVKSQGQIYLNLILRLLALTTISFLDEGGLYFLQ